jgi:hypothetical protein
MTREARYGRRRAASRSFSLVDGRAVATDREAASKASRAALQSAGFLMLAAIGATAAFQLTTLA